MTRTAAAAALLLALAGCATTQLDAQWTNPDYAGRSLRGAPVLVACEAQEPTLQRICEDQVAGQITALGGVPTRSTQVAGTGPAAGTDPYLAAARRIGARAIVRTTLNTGAVVASQGGPTVGIGIGGGGGYRGGVGGFGGISFPVGGTRVSNAYTSETAVIDPANGAIMWSARASSSTAQDATGQIAELAQTAVGALRQSGFY
ncbi:MAG TPA: hypothetical protein VFN64_10620 [Burkholderiaceae bacterium]|nr:hypothetical protein [Burkholderiaceae bacterium]